MTELLSRFHEEHEHLWKGIESIKQSADDLDLAPPEAVTMELEETHNFLTHHLIPHAEAEEQVLYRAYDQIASSPWATDTMRHDHTEVRRMVQELTAVQLQLFTDPPTEEQKRELRRILYGLYALLKAHFASEEAIILPRLEEGLTKEAAAHLIESLDNTTGLKESRAGW